MVHHLSHDPLVPGMLPVLTRVLAVGDTARLALLVPNLHLLGYQAVTTSTDPAAGMAGLCLQGGQGFNFDVVIVDITSEYPCRGAALQLFEFAVREPQLCGPAWFSRRVAALCPSSTYSSPPSTSIIGRLHLSTNVALALTVPPRGSSAVLPCSPPSVPVLAAVLCCSLASPHQRLLFLAL